MSQAPERVRLRNGGFSIIDSEDFAKVSRFKWHRHKSGYAHSVRRNGVAHKLHRLILGITDPKIQADHRNRNPLDNRKSNLRIASGSQNQHNKPKQKLKNATSKYKGVSRNKKGWRAMINVNWVRFNLGTFKTQKQAALAYNHAAKLYLGEFACLNKIK